MIQKAQPPIPIIKSIINLISPKFECFNKLFSVLVRNVIVYSDLSALPIELYRMSISF